MSNITVNGSRNKVTGDRNKIINKNKITISIGTVAIILIGIVVFLSLSSKNIEDKIIGTWQNEENTEQYITFLDNYKISFTDSEGTFDGMYIFTGDKSVKIDIEIYFAKYVVTADVSLKGNTLKLDNVKEPASLFSRQNAVSFKKIK